MHVQKVFINDAHILKQNLEFVEKVCTFICKIIIIITNNSNMIKFRYFIVFYLITYTKNK